jgi:Rha family phage regulatory protein
MISNQDSLFPSFDDLIAAAPDENETPALPISAPTFGGAPTMSSLQIAEITGKDHTNVLRDIRNTLEQAGIGLSKFESSYLNSQNKAQPCFILPRRECDLVVSGYSVKYRLAIIDRWHELEAKQAVNPAQFLNDPAAMRSMLLGYTEKVLALQEEVAVLAPKAAGLDRIAGTDGTLTITESAKSLGLPPKSLFTWLADNKWIYKRGAEWLPFQSKINSGAMDCKVRSFEGSTNIHTVSQARLTPKGISILAASLNA